MSRYGWVVNVERCNYLDADANGMVFNVNLGRPWAEEQGPQNLRGPAQAGKRLGDLLFPWSWKNPHWTFLALDKNGVWRTIAARQVPGTSSELAKTEAENLQLAVRKEVEETCDRCEYPFSQEMEDFWAEKESAVSHVHALAPLTHWPALVSEKVLRLTFFIVIDSADLGDATHVAAFPEFEIQPTDLLGKEIRLKKAPPAAPKIEITNKKKVEIVAEYDTAAVAFHCLAAAVEDVTFSPGTATLTQGLATAGAIRNSVQNELLPARLLRMWAEKPELNDKVAELVKDADVREGLAASLWSALGTGREPREGAENIIELFLKPNQGEAAREVRDCLRQFKPSRAQMKKALIDSVVVLVGAREPADVWTETDRKRWLLRVNHFKYLDDVLENWKPDAGWNEADRKRWGLQDDEIRYLKARTTENLTFADAWISIAEMVLDQDTGLEIYGPWLAHAVDHELSTKPKADWPTIRAELLRPRGVRADVMQRGRGSGISDAQWAEAKSIARLVDPAKPVALTVNATGKLRKATLAHIEDVIGKSAYASLQPTLEPIVAEAVTEWAKQIFASMQRSRNRPRDRGIRIQFSKSSSGGSTEFQQLRGYAVALCAGVLTDKAQPWMMDASRAAWLTDTALRYRRAAGQFDWLDKKGGTGTAWMHETVGATENDGEDMVNVEYEGAPLAAPLSDDDDAIPYEPGKDGFKAIDLAWRKSDGALPLMGFGMLYKAATAALDNAGGVVEGEFRREVKQPDGTKAKLFAELAPAKHLADFATAEGALQYRSSEPPGAPVAINELDKSLYELSEETQAHAWQHRRAQDRMEQDRRRPKPVALLSQDSEHFPRAKSSVEMEFKPPRAHFAFIERWLNTDRVLIEKGKTDHVSDERLKQYSSLDLANFIERFRERTLEGVAVPTPEYHPAVAALGIEVIMPGGRSQSKFVDVKRLADAKLDPAKFKLKIEVKAENGAEVKLVVDLNKPIPTVTVTIPPGHFAGLFVYSLVDVKHFEEGNLASCRFMDGIQLPTVSGLEKWCAFGPAEYWFETTPVWREEDFNFLAPIEKLATAAVKLIGPQEVESSVDKSVYFTSPNLVTGKIKFAHAPWVNWVKGLYVQRHDWHWTGYPVDFPGADEPLDKWLPSLAGVESFRDFVDVKLSTSFDSNGQWRLGPDGNDEETFFRYELFAGRRPARYVSVFVRPVIRFRSWLEPNPGPSGPASLERKIWGAGLLVAGRAEPRSAERLPVPVLRHSIPMTATYEAEKNRSRGANGVLLVFDEAILRTDELARLGGVGDVFEVDLVETRVAGVAESGNNPIFHGKMGPWTEKNPLRLQVMPPLGLTFDIGTNAKVAQTALIVQPENAAGRWILAKARVRRAVLPETELGTRVAQAQTSSPGAPHPDVKAWYSLANRLEGENAIPPDVVIDNDTGGIPDVVMKIGGKSCVVVMPKKFRAQRYVISWHRARWSENVQLPSWRCQVLAQERDGSSMAWRTVDKSSGHQNVLCELPQGYREADMFIGISGEPPLTKLMKIRLSDYTDPVWLTFIGSFGMEKLGSADRYVFGRDENGALELQSRDGASEELPALRGLDECLKDDKDLRWHLVLAFRAAKDVTRGKAGQEGGVLMAAYWKREGRFTRLPQKPGDDEPDLTGCRAYVVALQRVNALSKHEEENIKAIASMPELLNFIFPAQLPVVEESLMRFLPEYLGPIEILE